jgi:hypothetical protein
MSNPRQPSLFQTSKQQETKCRRIDRENREAARIILSEVRYQGGLMEEWARRMLLKGNYIDDYSGIEKARG